MLPLIALAWRLQNLDCKPWPQFWVADIHTVFACDIWSGSRHWLQTLGVQPILADMNTRVWNKEAGRITTRDIHGNAIQISTKDDIDLYVCGFTCTSFAPSVRRNTWADSLHSRRIQHRGHELPVWIMLWQCLTLGTLKS